MSLREKVGGAIQRAGARLAGYQSSDPAGAGYWPGSGGGVANVDRPIGSTDATPGSRQLWELRPARTASRNLAIGAPHLRAFLAWARVHVTGHGQTRLHWPRVMGENKPRLAAAQSWLRDEWQAFCDVPYGSRDEKVPALGQQILYTMLRDGDAFGVPYTERTAMGKRRRRLQVYPGDALAEVELYAAPGRTVSANAGEQRALGITYGPRGKAITYHFGHGGRVPPVGWGGYSSEVDQVDMPSRRVWHFMDQAASDPNTYRAMPWATAALDTMSRLDEFDRAFIRSAVMRATVGLALKKDPEKTATVSGSAMTSAERARAASGEGVEASQDRPLYRRRQDRRGDVLEIEAGYDTANTYPGSPNAQEGLHIERLEKRLCGALRVSLSTLLGDYKGQNFSASQQGTLQEKETVKMLQRVIIEVFYARVFDGFFADRWITLMMMFPEVRPEDEWALRMAAHKLPQYVALEKHRMIPAVGQAFLQGLFTYAEARDELGQTTADLEAIIQQVKDDHAALGVTMGGAGGSSEPSEDDGEEEPDEEEEKDDGDDE